MSCDFTAFVEKSSSVGRPVQKPDVLVRTRGKLWGDGLSRREVVWGHCGDVPADTHRLQTASASFVVSPPFV